MPYVDLNGDTRELAAGDLVVGSGNQATWRLPNMDLAARHLVFTAAPGGPVSVRPFTGSALVTVNGRRIEGAAALADGDVVGAGSADFVLVADPSAPRIAPARAAAFLIDETNGVAYALTRKALHLGRDAGSTIQLRDPAVSRYHADVRSEAGLHVLYSLGAAGTRVNDAAIGESRILEDGDRVRIGELTLRYTRAAPPAGMRVSAGGEDYDLEISQLPTGQAGKFDQRPMAQVQQQMRHPRVTRAVGIVVVLLVVVLATLIVWML